MPCERCGRRERVAAERAKLSERHGRVAVVLGVPMEECLGCGQRWLAWNVALELDVILDDMFMSEFEVAARRYAT